MGLALLSLAGCDNGASSCPVDSATDTAPADEAAEDVAPPDDAGEEAEADTGGGACPGVTPHVTPACEECRATSCCDEAQLCAADADCRAWLECNDACDPTDAACRNTCWETLPAEPVKANYAACAQRECSGICVPAECTADFGYEDAEDAECRACRNLHCCAEETTCWRDPRCVEAMECYATCRDDLDCFISVCNNA